MKQLLEHIITEQSQLTEVNWKAMAGSALIAANLLTGVPNVDAKAQSSITQAEKRIDIDKLLYAIKQVESSGGSDTRTRYEPGVEKQLRARFDKLNSNTREAIKKYGYNAIATSYGPYQLLGSTAYDLGFNGEVEDLKDETISEMLARKLIKKLINSSRTKKVEDVVSAYNAGLGNIGKNPSYIDKVLKYYQEGVK